MKIENGKTYRLIGSSKYFHKKYGTSTPKFRVDGTDKELFHGQNWFDQNGNIACLLFATRVAKEHLPIFDEIIYGGQVAGNSELVVASELKEIEE